MDLTPSLITIHFSNDMCAYLTSSEPTLFIQMVPKRMMKENLKAFLYRRNTWRIETATELRTFDISGCTISGIGRLMEIFVDLV